MSKATNTIKKDVLTNSCISFLIITILPKCVAFAEMCQTLTSSILFTTIINIIVIINSILLTLYQDPSNISQKYFYIEIAFLIIYIIESILKQISNGLITTHHGYLKDAWNILDLIQIIISILCLFPSLRNNRYIIWFRALRPIRIIKIIPKLKAIVNSVASSVREMLNVLILLLFVFLLYAVLAVNLWSGIFSRRCRRDSTPSLGVFVIEENITTICGGLIQCENCKSIADFYEDGEYLLNEKDIETEQDIEELNYGYSNFDNFFSAFLTIYNCMSLQGWSKIMYMVQNGYSFSASSIYFITLVVILNFLVLNFTIAILMNNIEINMKLNHCEDTFQVKIVDLEIEAKKILKKEISFLNLLKNFEFLLVFLKSLKINIKVQPKYLHHLKYRITFYCYIISIQPFWDYINYIIIIVNITYLSKEYQNKETEKIISILIIIFFNCDWILKLLGLGVKHFYSDYQNILNCLVSLGCLFEFIFFSTTVLSVIKLINVLNIVYALKDFKDFQIMLYLLHKTISSIGYFFILIFLLTYIFALIGISLFKGAFENDEIPRKNFENIGTAMKTVFSLMIGDDWYIAMISFLRRDKASNIASYIFFIFTNLILSILMMNLVVAFLVYHFEQARTKQKYKELVLLIKNGERAVGYKRSLSFSFTNNTKTQQLFQEDEDFLSDSDISILSDLYDYELISDDIIKDEPKNSHSVNLAKVVHDVNTDRILSMDNFGFGGILRKIKNKNALNKSMKIVGASNNGLGSNVNEMEKKKSKKGSYCIPPVEQLNIPINIDGHDETIKDNKEFFANTGIERDNLLDIMKSKANMNVITNTNSNTTKINNYILKPFIEKSNASKISNNAKRKSFIINSKNASKGKNTNLLTLTSTNRNYDTKSAYTNSVFGSMSEKMKHFHRLITVNKAKSMVSHIFGSKSNFSKKIKKFTNSKFYLYISQSSLFIFHKNSAIRKICMIVTNNTIFNIICLILVIMSCIVIMLDTAYVDQKSTKKKILYNCDGVFTIIFMIEMFLRIISDGLIFSDREDSHNHFKKKTIMKFSSISSSSSSYNSSGNETDNERSKSSSKISINPRFQNSIFNNEHPPLGIPSIKNSQVNISANTLTKKNNNQLKKSSVSQKPPYLRNIFNILDCAVIITNLISFIKSKAKYNNSSDNSKLIYLRALRPLRMISNFAQLRQVVHALILSIPSIIYMILIAFVIFLVYAIIGFNYFKYLLGSCDNEMYNTKEKCESHNYQWIQAQENFDSISSSLLTVYELASTSGWYDIMEEIVIKTNDFSCLFFISFMIIGSLFIMNFSVTCVVNTFTSLKEKLEGDAFLTDEQKEWVKSVKMLMKFKPVPTVDTRSPRISKLRKVSYLLIKHKLFNITINGLIFIDIITLCLTHFRQKKVFEDIQTYTFYCSTFFFCVEMLIKIIAFKSLFFIDTMNKFDFSIVILSSISVVLSVIKYYNPDSIYFDESYDFLPGLMKGIRILRVFRLININFAIKNYLKILLFIFPQLTNVVSLIMMNICSFSILCIHLFSTVKFGEVINENCNFKDIFSALILLTRVLTGDEWNDIMNELAMKQPGCIEGNEQSYESLMRDGPQGCGKWVSYPFFICFMILNSMVIVNMFIAVIVGTFVDENVDQSKNELSIKDAKEFYTLWSKYDCKVSYSVDLSQFVLFMIELKYPMGLNGDKLFYDYINKKELKGKIYSSKDNTVMIDESQCITILDKLGVIAKNGKIHILDAIKLVSKRYIIATKEKEEIDNIEYYRHELKMLDIKHKKIGKKLQERFISYHQMYDKMNNELSSKALAKKIICKFVREWKKKRNNNPSQVNNDSNTTNHFWQQIDYDYNYKDFEFT